MNGDDKITSKINVDELKARAQDALRDPEKLEAQVLNSSRSFYEDHKNDIAFWGFCVAVYLVEKRMVKKVVRKELGRALTQMGFAIEMVNDPSSGNILIAQIRDFGKELVAR
jgi:hypothetical protein